MDNIKLVIALCFLLLSCNRSDLSVQNSEDLTQIDTFTLEDKALYNSCKEWNNDDLHYLALKGNNPDVKTSAIKMLIIRNDPYIFEVFKKSIRSKDSIPCGNGGCIITPPMSIPNYIFQELYFPLKFRKPKIAEQYRLKIYDMVLDGDVNIKLLEELYMWFPSKEKYYQKIRILAQKNDSKEILAILATYRKKQDISLIKSRGESAFLAINEFPDDEFLPMLMDYTNLYDKVFEYNWALDKFSREKTKDIRIKIAKSKTPANTR